jgi:dTDP-4-amino-4,6-dideoxy-D-galactose acyltransferase
MIHANDGLSAIKLRPLRPDLAEARGLLAEHLPWSPLDFIPGISRRGDRLLLAEQLTGLIDDENDFRFRAELPDRTVLGIFAEQLAWDSEFFGYGVARLHGIFPLSSPWFVPRIDYRPALEPVLRKLARRDVRYLWCAVDPRDLPLLRALGELGFSLIETRYLQHGPVRMPPGPERYPIRLATEADIPSLARAASQTINPYDRFHADPFIQEADAARLMEKWVEQSVLGKMADVVIVPDVPEPGAFVTYRYHRDKWSRWGVNLVQGVLSAVSKDFMGWMGKLGPEVNLHLRSIGAEYSFGSTQVTNRSIIWFAQEMGASFGRCEHIFRILL